MSHILRLVAAALFLTVWSAGASAEKLAFVVGNDTYLSVDRLQKARNDAVAVGGVLREIGFDRVEVLKDTTSDGFAEALSSFTQRVQPGDTVVLFYAGHGVEIDNRNYLLPVDISAPAPGHEALIKRKAFAADEIIAEFRTRGAGTVVAVLDACRNNPFAKTDRSIGRGSGLAQMTADPGVFIIFSAGAKQTALDRLSDADTDPNSVFTRVFLQEVRKPDADLANIAIETRGRVIKLASDVDHVQTPAYYDQLTRRISLSAGAAGERPPAITLPAAAAVPERSGLGAEAEAFALANTIGSVEAWDAFLTQFPSGSYAGFAQAARAGAEARLTAAAAPQTPAQSAANTGFFFPDSDSRYITRFELYGMTREQLRLARNEIFARRGRFFRSTDLDQYFRRFPWYQPSAAEVRLNEFEETNVANIEKFEASQ